MFLTDPHGKMDKGSGLSAVGYALQNKETPTVGGFLTQECIGGIPKFVINTALEVEFGLKRTQGPDRSAVLLQIPRKCLAAVFYAPSLIFETKIIIQ